LPARFKGFAVECQPSDSDHINLAVLE
jgi:hypothetical protein